MVGTWDIQASNSSEIASVISWIGMKSQRICAWDINNQKKEGRRLGSKVDR